MGRKGEGVRGGEEEKGREGGREGGGERRRERTINIFCPDTLQ